MWVEKQSLGNIQRLGTGRIKKVFTEDIDMIELLLAHAIPEGIANVVIPLIIIILIFGVDYRLGLLSLLPLFLGLVAMGMMMLSPLVVSLPLKILLFVLVDGWALTISTLVSSVQGR